MIIKDQDQQWVVDYARNLILENIVVQKANALKRITSVSKDLINKSQELKSLNESQEFLTKLEDCFENNLDSKGHDSIIDKLAEINDYANLSNMIIGGIQMEISVQERILDILISKGRIKELKDINKYRYNLETPIQEKLDATLLFDKLEKSSPKPAPKPGPKKKSNWNPFENDDDKNDDDWDAMF